MEISKIIRKMKIISWLIILATIVLVFIYPLLPLKKAGLSNTLVEKITIDENLLNYLSKLEDNTVDIGDN